MVVKEGWDGMFKEGWYGMVKEGITGITVMDDTTRVEALTDEGLPAAVSLPTRRCCSSRAATRCDSSCLHLRPLRRHSPCSARQSRSSTEAFA